MKPMSRIVQVVVASKDFTVFMVLCENGALWLYTPAASESNQWSQCFSYPPRLA